MTESTPETAVENVPENSVSPAEPEPKKTRKAKAAHKSPPRYKASGGKTDDVYLSKLSFGGHRVKSLSVVHLQARLADLGYRDGLDGDLNGNPGAATQRALHAWQAENDYTVGQLTQEQATALFEGDGNVRLVLDTAE